MSSTVIAKNVQIGADGTASNNFTIFQPATPDGTLRIGNGNTGITSSAVALTSAGNVGIGTSSPTTRLSVVTASTNAGISVNDGTVTTIIYNSTGGVSSIGTTTNHPVDFYANNAARMRIDSSGNVGIGTSSPTAKLEVYDASSAVARVTAGTEIFEIRNTGSEVRLAVVSADPMTFRTSNVEAMRIDSAGNVGIGNTAANVNDQVGAVRPLLVSKSDTSTTIAGSQANIVIGNADTTTNNTSQISFAALTGANTTYFASAAINCVFGARTNGQYPTGQLVFSTSTSLNSAPTEKMRIDSSGNLLVGTTSQLSNGGLFCLRRSSAANVASFQNGSDAGYGIGFINASGTAVGSISWTASATSFNTSSDYRLKHDIAPMTGALAKVAALKPVTYKWNVDNSEGEGFIAHELAEVCPQAVVGEKDAVETYTDEEGNEQTRPKYQGIDTSFLVATLTAAIQELKAINDAQAETITALTARVTALEGA